MRTILLPHNKAAYRKVMKAFETSDRTCIVHPTGTGKSYLIAAVSENFKRVLILAPSQFILQQQRKVMKGWPAGVDFATYSGLSQNIEAVAGSRVYDLIVLDEFHRAGAQEWGAAVKHLLELNAGAKVFGTSATPVRYLDGERDMADELFDGNIANQITIAEAWVKYKILPIPRYVRGLFQWDKTVADTKERIERSRNLTAEEKRQRIFRLTNTRLHWELSYGMPAILKKHLDKDARRVIVFCGHIEGLEKMRQEVIGWFREAGFTIASTCIMHSDLTDRDQREQMKQFEDDTDGKGVKLMFSVNMLNEGIHVPNVSAVIMLRTTDSRIIYMQQLGRCLTAANTEKPLVLDMVDNITTTTAIKDIADEFDRLEAVQAESEGREPRKFEVKDYTLGVRELIEKLVPAEKPRRRLSFEEHLNIVREYCSTHGCLPNHSRHEATASWAWLRLYHGESDEVMALREQYGKLTSSEEFKNAYIRYIIEHHRLPTPRCEDAEGKRLGFQWSYFRRYLIKNPDIKKLRKKYSVWQIRLTERIKRVEKFCKKNGRPPISKDGDIFKEWQTLICGKNRNDPRCITLRHTYQKKGTKRDEGDVRSRLQPLFDFLEKKQRLPLSNDKERSLYNQLYRLKRIEVLLPVEQELLKLAAKLKKRQCIADMQKTDNVTTIRNITEYKECEDRIERLIQIGTELGDMELLSDAEKREFSELSNALDEYRALSIEH